MSENKSSYFLYPLINVSLFPRTTKPINVYDPLSIKMIKESIHKGIPIAIGYVPEDSSVIHSVAGYSIPQIIETRSDGSMLVFMSGLGKLHLELTRTKVLDGLTYVEAEILNENLSLNEIHKPKYKALSEALVRWIRHHIPDPHQREVFIQGLVGPQEVIGAFAAYLIFDYDLQYEVMEILSLNEQIEFLYRLLESGKLANN